MGFLREIKKLLWAKKAVAKSAADKSADYVKEKADDIVESTKEFATDAGKNISSKTSGLRDAVMDKAGDLVDKSKDVLGDVADKGKEIWDDVTESEPVKKAAEFTENVGDTILDLGETTMEKAKDITAKVGEEVLDKGGDLMEKAKKVSEGLGEKVLDVKDDIVDRAKEMSGKISETLDETIEKAQKMAEEEAATPKKEFADDTLDAGESLLSGSDDFFSKAARYAEGDYDSVLEGTTKIIPNDAPLAKKDPSPAAGFEDLDGDGNELIDDAIITEEE